MVRFKIIDPTCGTGGFLVATMNILREHIREQQLRKWRDKEGKAEEETNRILKEIVNKNLLGIDFNPILVRAAQMNLVMHGDGSTNIFQANSLTSVLLLQKKTETEIQLEEELEKPKDYQIFMTMPEAVGHDRRGNVHYLRTPEGELIEYEEEKAVSRRTADGSTVREHRRQRKRVVHDDLPEVVKFFAGWLEEENRMEWLNG